MRCGDFQTQPINASERVMAADVVQNSFGRELCIYYLSTYARPMMAKRRHVGL